MDNECENPLAASVLLLPSAGCWGGWWAGSTSTPNKAKASLNELVLGSPAFDELEAKVGRG